MCVVCDLGGSVFPVLSYVCVVCGGVRWGRWQVCVCDGCCVFRCSVGCVFPGVHGVPWVGNGSQCVQCVFGIHVSVDCLVGGFVLFGQVDDCGGVLVCDEYLLGSSFGCMPTAVCGEVSLVWCGVWDGCFPLGPDGLVCACAV